MSRLGQQSTGFTYTVSTWGDLAGGSYTVPSPGILVSDINAYVGNNGTAQQGRLYVWQDNGAGKPGTWLIRGHATFTLLASSATGSSQSTLDANGAAGISADLYLPAGTVIWIGVYCAGSTEQIQAAAASGGGTEIGNTSDGNWSDHGAAALGQMAAYIDYTPLPAPTLSGASPSVAAQGQSVTLSGTGLLHATGVTVCGVAATSYTIASDTSITLTVPAGAAGSGTIVVTTPAGTASTAFTAGSLYGDNGSAWVAGALGYGDSGSAQQQAQVWADDGAAWHQVG